LERPERLAGLALLGLAQKAVERRLAPHPGLERR